MSRWEALKSDNKGSNNTGGTSNAQSSTAVPPRTNSRWSDPQKTARNSRNRSPPQFTNLTSTWIDAKVALSDANDPMEFEKAARKLTALSTSEFRTVPAEQAAHDVVEGIIMVWLSKTESSSRLEQFILKVIHKLLHQPRICSAITTPLTMDVAETTGVEDQIPNPVGEKLLQQLQERLPQSCEALTLLIDEIRKRNITDSLRVDVVLLQSFFSRKQQLHQGRALELLRLVLTTYPDCHKSFQSLLLSDFRFNSRRAEDTAANCKTCSYRPGTSLLLDLVHSGQFIDQATECIDLLLKAFPLDAWLNPKTAGSMHFFGENVKSDLTRLLRLVVCRFSPTESLCNLIATSLSSIPHTTSKDDALSHEGIKVVSCLATAVMADPSQSHAIECFCECMGGRPQPNGGNTPMALPTKLWLTDASSFREYLSMSVLDQNTTSHYAAATKILCAVVRARPDFIPWKQLQLIIEKNSANTQRRGDAMNLLERFAVGRSESITGLDQNLVAEFLVKTIGSMTFDSSRKVRHSCLQAYCAFLPSDWSYAARANEFEVIVNSLKHYSKNGNSSEKPLALKAIGELLSKCLSERSIQDEYLAQLCTNISPVLMSGLQEANPPPVRSMSAFAVGNLSLGIRERNSVSCILSPSDVLPLMDLLCASLSASNDKLVGNSIRSVGHLVFVTFHEPYVSQLEKAEARDCFRGVVRKLSEKLQHAMGGTSSSKLTWKERSSAKKHGWGACHSLGHILNCDSAIEHLDESREACAALINCVKLHAVLTEKIVMAALVAMQRLEPSHLAVLSRRTGLVGLAVSVCLGLMVDAVSLNQRIKSEVGKLLQHLLPVLSVLDAEAVLQSDAITSKHLEWLYDWMLQHKLTAEPYEKFAMALDQSNDWDGSISLEQRFASRAAWSYREGSTPEGVSDVDDEL